MTEEILNNLFLECREINDRYSYAKAGEILHVNVSTICRYGQRGVLLPSGSRVMLETIRLGGRVYTSRQAVERFIKAIN